MVSKRRLIRYSQLILFGLVVSSCTNETIVQPVVAPSPLPDEAVALFVYDKPDEGRVGVVGLRKHFSDANIGGLVCPNPGSLSTTENPVVVIYTIDNTYLNAYGHVNTWTETVMLVFTFASDTTITL